MSSKLYPYTVQDTGVTFSIRKVSPMLVNEINKAYPKPVPPMNEVDYGDGKKVKEPNESDPDYQKQLREHRTLTFQKMQELMVERGVIIELTSEQKAEVKQLRDQFKTIMNKELTGSDKSVFIFNIAIGTDSDLNELIQAITRRSQPTEEAIGEHLDTFRS